MSERLREALIATAVEMNRSGLSAGTSGNVSVRSEEGMLITPSGMAYDRLAPRDLVRVDGSGAAAGPRRPSSEWRFHLAIYLHRPDAGAVVHAHPTHATALACLGRGLPPFHYMVAMAGGRDIRCARYETPGSPALSDAVLEALEGRKACLMANHGLLCLGRDLDAALGLAREVEQLARVYLACLQGGEPVLLTDAEMERMQQVFLSYGRQDAAD